MKNNSATALTNQINKVFFDFQLSSSQAHFIRGSRDGTDKLRIHNEAPHLGMLTLAQTAPPRLGEGCTTRGGTLSVTSVLQIWERSEWGGDPEEGHWHCRGRTPTMDLGSPQGFKDPGPSFAHVPPASLHPPHSVQHPNQHFHRSGPFQQDLQRPTIMAASAWGPGVQRKYSAIHTCGLKVSTRRVPEVTGKGNYC